MTQDSPLDPENPIHGDLPIVDADRLRRRAAFLRDLAEAQALLDRVTPRRARTARLRARLRETTFRG